MNRGILALLAAAFPLAASAYDVEVIQSNGDPGNRYDIVVLGDGYRDIDQTKLTTDTNWFLSAFWQQTPFGNYRGYFNVKLVHVISAERGADNGTYCTTCDTALGAYYNCNNIDRLLCVNAGTVLSVAASHVPEYDTIFVIVNDPKYGGAGYSSGIAVFSVHSSAPEIAEHEFGHSFGGLADEYEDAYPGYPPCGSDCPEPNVTNHDTLSTIKWNLWIDGGTPIPTPETSAYANVVGLFEGARYQSTGVYRPRLNCKMRSLGAGFCQVCSEAMVWSIYREIDPIDSASPDSPVNITGCEVATFSVVHPRPSPDTIQVSWWLDGALVASGSDTYQLSAQQLLPGAHTVEVEASDETTLARSDPQSLLWSRRVWQVNVSGSAGGYCLVGTDCWPAGTVNPQNPCQACRPAINPSDWTADDSLVCDDGQWCNGTATCSGGACQPGAEPCPEDGIACTQTCDEANHLCNVVAAGWCLISGQCYPAGAAHPQNPCRICQPATSQTDWTDADGLACDDSLFCNGLDTCVGGSCGEHTGDPCTAGGECADACDELRDECLLPPGTACSEDGNPCTDDVCNGEGACIHINNELACEDGIFCNGEERCRGGVCAAGTPPCADDGLACTDDSCDEAGDRCLHTVQAGWCAVDGACLQDGQAFPDAACRLCDPAAPEGWRVAADGTVCQDGDDCTENDRCQAGLCLSGKRLCSADCPCSFVQGGCGCSAAPETGAAGLFFPAIFFFRRSRKFGARKSVFET